MKKFFLLLALIICFNINIYPQFDTVDVEEQGEEDKSWREKFDFDKEFELDFTSHNSPMISLNYGMGQLSHDKFNTNFSKVNSAEIRLGYVKRMEEENSLSSIFNYNLRYLGIANTSYRLAKSKNDANINADMWRVNIGWQDGYGYKFGNSAIIFYDEFGINWTRLDVKDLIINLSDREKLEMYNQSFRFGNKAEGGIKIEVIPNLSLDAAYERTAIFERVLFWKWCASVLLEVASKGLINNFVNEIKESSPYAVPIVNFVLKNALTYGLYELRKEKMNWPFESNAPIVNDTFRFGVTFNF